MNNCESCGCDEFVDLGYLGSRWHLRCRDCGWTSSHDMQEENEEGFVAADDSDPDPEDRDLDFMDEEYPRDDDFDGQPDELQEWHDFDPDC